MSYQSEADRLNAEIEAARKDLGRARQAHSKGAAPVERINEANERLAHAHARWREWSGGNVPDNR